MDKKRNMDELFRDKLADFSVDPPASVWINIEAQLEGRRRKVRWAYFRWTAAAAVLVIALLAGWLLRDQSMPQSPEIMREQAAVQKEQPQEKTAVSIHTEQNNKLAAKTDSENREQPLSETHAGEQRLAAAAVSGSQEEQNSVSGVKPSVIQLVESIKGFINREEEVKLAVRRPYSVNVKADEEKLSEADRNLIASNARNIDPDVMKTTRWIIGAHVDPGYTSHASSYSNAYAESMNYNPETGLTNVGAGLSVQYKTGKRTRIESGFYYAQSGQKTGSSHRMFAMNPSYDFAYGDGMVGGDNLFINAISLREGDLIMNSTAGVVNIDHAPQGALLASVGENTVDEYSSVITANGQFSQLFDFVEIPVYMRYNLLDKKFGIDIMGGLNAGILVGNNAYIENDYGRQRIGRTEDISTLNLSGTIGLGMNYALSKHMKLALEPRFSYYLNSINTSSDVDYKPYRVGLYTGVYYAF